MKKVIVLIILPLVVLAVAASCGTPKSVVAEPLKADTVVAAVPVAPKPEVKPVAAHPDVISIAEAVTLLSDMTTLDDVVKKYKYKNVSPYGVYRLDNYGTMLYKNCRLPRKLGDSVYENTPQPLAKGTSSYVAINTTVGTSVIMAVFNPKAYANLLEQILGLGFVLVETGHEDRYTNGTVDIYCFASNKRIRIEKTNLTTVE